MDSYLVVSSIDRIKLSIFQIDFASQQDMPVPAAVESSARSPVKVSNKLSVPQEHDFYSKKNL
ncbi:hypothetical protein CANTEDRAFT_113397 [Yamadazyma tenuis ATCC 10573]|uniref:Uncharacterized protein n=1 Tax=Candida tenuis (strain ATCC 10573 / BCRC 21748 / CBS 615 / JCM 9827 / NBRC 10315 / NRRL Y-1498 / VKM Y-70) TaxID=590646 RepID=G3B286_CANTC|nr:uncharacterized protein CANTEDRAFT_113397 [Yamadazyma tenuis ATCC 10573]EGV64616.1 hypothetical protein CANTEDRAFT_113397 [Yamadazyma tenuis ATCC 10573]